MFIRKSSIPNEFHLSNKQNKAGCTKQISSDTKRRGLTRRMLIVGLAFLRYLIQFLKAIKLVVAICIACFWSTIIGQFTRCNDLPRYRLTSSD